MWRKCTVNVSLTSSQNRKVKQDISFRLNAVNQTRMVKNPLEQEGNEIADENKTVLHC
jgi:hypothetical protein